MSMFSRILGLENRASVVTDQRIEEIYAKAMGRNNCSAVKEAMAGIWARGLSMGRVGPETAGLDSNALSHIGRQLLLRGEAVYYLSMSDRIRAVPVSGYDIAGENFNDEGSYVYNIDIPTPNGNVSRKVLGDEVLHFKINADYNTPWKGKSPLDCAQTTLTALEMLESRLCDELGTPVGYIIPHQRTKNLEDMDKLEGALKDGGGVFLIEDVNNVNRPNLDHRTFTQQRVGCQPSPEYKELYRMLSERVWAAGGVPTELMVPGNDGGSHRESWRRFIFNVIMPVGRMIEEEISAKIAPVSINFSELQASDITSRSRAFSQLTTGGIDPERALELAGFGD